MYYNRILSNLFSSLLERKGEYRWLFDFVKGRKDLGFLLGKTNNKEWISIYRGLSRVLMIIKTRREDIVKIEGAEAYKRVLPNLFGKKEVSDNFNKDIKALLCDIKDSPRFNKHYNNRKEGYYQNELSRKFGIYGKASDNFIIIDKEAVIGYKDINEKNEIYGTIHKKYKELLKKISKFNPKRFGSKLETKSIGNKVDFIALDKNGDLLLIECKHGTNTPGIYLSPLQIGMYFELFNKLPRKDLEDSIYKMIAQKKEIGLINKNWRVPKFRKIKPVLIISEFNKNSCAYTKFKEVKKLIQDLKNDKSFLNNLEVYEYSTNKGLKNI